MYTLLPSSKLLHQARAGLLALVAAFVAPLVWAGNTAAPLPTDSVYHLNAQLTDQAGKDFAIADRRGHPVLVGMFYTSCQFVCPMLVEALRDTEAKLTPEERGHLSVLLVTIDPARDTVAVLKRTADERALDPAHWTVARTDAKTTRKLAAVLGVQYRALPNGDFNHTTDLILLDADGRIAGRTAQLGSADAAFVKQVKATTH
ncbi:MAG: SCO family protein [Rhodoferax sp.]